MSDPEESGPPDDQEPSDGVTDDDRNRFGLLLDSAAERGLLSPLEYELRLGAIAEATSIDELQRLVTELPAFSAPVPADASARPTDGILGLPVLQATRTRRRTTGPKGPTSARAWLLLATVVVAMVVAMAVLAIVASHIAHTHNGSGLVSVGPVRRLRL